MKTRNSKYAKSNILITSISLGVIFCLTVGYSLLTQNLDINTNVTLRAEKDIRISSVSNYSSVANAYEVYNSSYTSDTFTSNIGLPQLNSEISYSIIISNYGLKAMEITGISMSVFNNDSMTYNVSGANVGTVIEKDNSITLTIVYKYKSSTLVLPDNKELGSILELSFAEYIPNKQYVLAGSLLDLRGIEAPVGTSWVDIRNNKTLALVNGVYDSSLKLYNFEGADSYGTLGVPIIPETGDFTLEAFIKTPSRLLSGTDQAIIAQVNDTQNDSGRFKLNIKDDAGSIKLLLFFNSQNPSTNTFVPFNTFVSPSTNYTMQVVRKGDFLELYLNRKLVKTFSYTADNRISQGPFKVGRWNDASNQLYEGGIYAVRVYNRALTFDELILNDDIDMVNYTDPGTTTDLKTYVLANHVVTSGNGLYDMSDNKYIYKGHVENNYIKFLGDSDLYRIVSFNKDGTIKLINETYSENSAFDASGNRIYDPSTSSYCTYASTLLTDGSGDYYGCNYYGTTTDYFGLNVPTQSTIKSRVDAWYTALDPGVKKYLLTHNYNAGLVSSNATYTQARQQASSIIYNGYAGLIELMDVLDSEISPMSKLSTGTTPKSYLIDISSSTTGYWSINGSSNNSYDTWAVVFGTQLGVKRASRINQFSGKDTAYFQVKPVIYVQNNLIVKGNGTPINPFIIVEKGPSE